MGLDVDWFWKAGIYHAAARLSSGIARLGFRFWETHVSLTDVKTPPYVLFHYLSDTPLCTAVRAGFERRWRALSELPVFACSLDINRAAAENPACRGWAGFLASEALRREAEATSGGRPVVNYSNHSGACPHTLNVFTDDEEIARKAADAFLAKGYTRFAYVGLAGHGYSGSRGEAFRDYLATKGHAVLMCAWDDLLTENPVAFFARRCRMLREWIDRLGTPAAVLAANDHTALDVLRFLREDLPEKLPLLAVAGVDDSPQASANSLSSVAPDFGALGATVADTLHAALEDGAWTPGAVRRVPGARWVERSSTGGFVSSDGLVMQLVREIHAEITAGGAPKVEQLAERHGVTRRTLLNRFRAATGCTLRDYVLAERLKRAAGMLAGFDQNIAEIAFACGFGKQGDLSERFKQAYGVSPSEYRDRHRTGSEHGAPE